MLKQNQLNAIQEAIRIELLKRELILAVCLYSFTPLSNKIISYSFRTIEDAIGFFNRKELQLDF